MKELAQKLANFIAEFENLLDEVKEQKSKTSTWNQVGKRLRPPMSEAHAFTPAEMQHPNTASEGAPPILTSAPVPVLSEMRTGTASNPPPREAPHPIYVYPPEKREKVAKLKRIAQWLDDSEDEVPRPK